MQGINIAGHVKELMIFDDPEFCNNPKNHCRFLEDMSTYCILYNSENQVSKKCGLWLVQKCDQCKAAYQRAKGKKYTGCVLDIGLNDIPQLCVLDDPECDKCDCIYSEEGKTKENCGYWKTKRIK